MNGIGIGDLRCSHDIRYVQIGSAAGSRADTDSLIGKFYMETFPVGRGINRHGSDSHFPAGPDDT